ncbi:MAG: hypothetical protein HY869_22225 [Chloroflexi bacterium]|nr:hypothetical protein [Chloroflexota bacterium]
MSHKSFRTILTAVLVLTLTQTACGLFTPQPKPSAADIEREEQAVYAFFVNDAMGPAVILQDTDTNINSDDPQETVDYVKSGLKSISNDTLDSYMDRNAQPGQLSPDMDLGAEYVLLSSDELSTIFNQSDGWDIFHQNYSVAGYKVFSRVGFNRTLDQALIYVGQMVGPLMGAGYYYLLEKENGEWIMKEQIMVWIS